MITNGITAGVIAKINELAFSELDIPISRILTPDVPIPYNIGLIELLLPSVKRVVNGLRSN